MGYGDISPENHTERSYTVGVMLLASVLYATVFANITSLIGEPQCLRPAALLLTSCALMCADLVIAAGKFDASGQRYKEKIFAITEFFKVGELLPCIASICC